MSVLSGLEWIKDERVRQIEEEGYTVVGDVGRAQALFRAGVTYLQYAQLQIMNPDHIDEYEHPSDVEWANGEPLWPWGREHWKPSTVLDNITRGTALVAAAMDHLEELT